MKEILDVIHQTIYQFFDACDDNEEVPMSDKDKLLLEVNKAICNNLKALEQEPKTGHWTKKEQLDEDGINTWWWYECSECGKQPLKGKYGKEVLSPFCPFCGAEMKEVEE